MLVELVGPSGAGKSTLAAGVVRHLRAGGTPAVLATDLVMGTALLRRVRGAQAANLVQDVRGLPHLLRSRREHAAVLRLATEVLREHAPTALDRVLNTRSVLRRLGMAELARRTAGGRVVLLDEGPLLIACHLFVYSSAGDDPAALARFAASVPVPDRVVYVRSALPALVERAYSRPDRRRQLGALTPEAAEVPLRRALDVFDALVRHPRLRERTVVVDNAEQDPAAADRLAAGLAASLRAEASAAPAADLETTRAVRR